MKTSSDVIGKPVITLDEGVRLGSVEDLLLDESQSRLLGFLVKPGMLAEPLIVNFSDIEAFGPDALISRSPSDASHAATMPVNQQANMQGKRVVTRDGRNLGTVRDLYFDEQSGEILGYELAHNTFAGLLPRRYVLPPSEGLTVGADVVLVQPEAADLLERKGAALKGLESRPGSTGS